MVDIRLKKELPDTTISGILLKYLHLLRESFVFLFQVSIIQNKETYQEKNKCCHNKFWVPFYEY